MRAVPIPEIKAIANMWSLVFILEVPQCITSPMPPCHAIFPEKEYKCHAKGNLTGYWIIPQVISLRLLIEDDSENKTIQQAFKSG
jgi:hypothetical protein